MKAEKPTIKQAQPLQTAIILRWRMSTGELMMRLALVVGLLGLLLAITVGQAQKSSTGKNAKKVIYLSSNNATFDPIPKGGVSMAAVWGEPDKGPHGTFTKFEPGYDAGMHAHTNDVWIVVLKGAYLYKDEAGEKRVGPGEFLRVPGGHKHWSGGDKTDGALFYEESSGKFDSIPAK
jgi:mannose-6-phosphate isomerase-like protein (cupin superfamily)